MNPAVASILAEYLGDENYDVLERLGMLEAVAKAMEEYHRARLFEENDTEWCSDELS